MRFITVYIVVFLFFYQNSFGQEHRNSGVYPNQKSFEVFQKQMRFLDACKTESDSLLFSLDEYLTKFTTHKKDSFIFKTHTILLTRSFQKFTDFNARYLVNIDKHLKSNMPVQGSQITYLNKSFQVFTNYNQSYDHIFKKADSIEQIHDSDFFHQLRLFIKLNQLSFFYKNYFTVIRNRRLRRILNTADKTFNKESNDLKRIAIKNLRRKNFNKLKKWSQKPCSLCKDKIVFQDSLLFTTIKDLNYSKTRIKQDKQKIKGLFRQDQAYKIGYFFTHHVSGAIGNFAGIFRFRKGYLYHNDSLIEIIKKRLKPMSILAEKTGFTLTDKMIPGYFGHIALWLGTEEQLKANHLWEHPVIKPFQNRIRLGYSVLETVREGTRLSKLKAFMDIDELALAEIVGFSKLSIEDKEVLYKNALAQLGKEYDFNFDVETSDKLVCSELLYQVFGSIHWPTDKYMKRNTISPDNVLSLVLYKNAPVELSYFIGANNRKNVYEKTKDDLAKNLGIYKKEGKYVLKQKLCDKHHKNCKTIYHPLIYK